MTKTIPKVPADATIKQIVGTPYIIIDDKHVARFLTPTVINGEANFTLFLHPYEGSRHALDKLVAEYKTIAKTQKAAKAD
jgi:hypothetical protein